MHSALAIYLGWQPLAHADGCRTTGWEVDTQTTYGAGGNPDASASSLRLLCRECGTVREHGGRPDSLHTSRTADAGYGQPPKRAAGLWLYPGTPLLRGESLPPYEYLCTRRPADRIDPDDVVGLIRQARTVRGRTVWTAMAGPEWALSSLDGPTPVCSWQHTCGDERFNTPTGAAKWIARTVAGMSRMA